MIPSAVFVAAVAIQNKFPLPSKLSRNPGSMPKTYSLHMFCRHRESIDRVSRETRWGVLREYGADGRLLLAVK